MNRVKIIKQDDGRTHRVFVGDIEVKGLMSVTTTIEVDEPTTVNIGLIAEDVEIIDEATYNIDQEYKTRREEITKLFDEIREHLDMPPI